MKIAKFKLYGNDCIAEYSETMDEDSDWIRMSDVVDVEFTDLPPEVTVPLQINLIDGKIADARAEFNQVIAKLEDAKSRLLAITHTE